MARRREIPECAEFKRIRALPRRRMSDEDAATWAEVYTELYARPGGSLALRPSQGRALAEIEEHGGAYLGYPVGTGKTLIFELAPLVLDSRRAILITDAPLRDKTYLDRSHYGRHFRLASPPPTIVTVRALTLEANARLLFRLQPDLILIDEADLLANAGMSATVRIDEYVCEHWDTVRVVAGTATPGRKSILDYWHVVIWCLKDKAPLPLVQARAEAWADVLDEKPAGARRFWEPGALGATTKLARRWYSKRLTETPGVIMLDEDSAAGVPLTIRTLRAKACPEIEKHYTKFVKYGVNPGGLQVSDPLSEHRLDAQLGSGYYQYWDPPPPEAWRTAYTTFCRFVRGKIKRSRGKPNRMDTEKQVVRRFRDHPAVSEWLEIKPTFTPNVCVEWLSDATLQSAQEWLRASKRPSIVWVGSVEFGRALSELTGLSYYRGQGIDQHKNQLVHAPRGKSFICSWVANYRGFNLQPWPRALVVQIPDSAKRLEQFIGRSHRAGATEAVEIDLLCTSGGALDKVEKMLREAAFGKVSYRLTQKILNADIRRCEMPTLAENDPARHRWARGADRFDPNEYY